MTRRRPTPTATIAVTMTTVAALLLTGCSTSGGTSASADPSRAATSAGVFDASQTHTISVDIDDADFTAMITEYLASGDKGWITGTVTVDGTAFTDVGLKLKGNSSLRSVSATSTPESVPWRIDLDKYVDGQNIDGYADFVVRASTSETSINEAVALDLLRDAGLATERAIATRFSVNGSAEVLTLVLQNLDDTWQEENFDDDGTLYKAESGGDYSYRGSDAAAYADAFSVEAGTDDYTPLIDFLDFVNNSSDAEFAADLSTHLDVQAFATYLALEDLIDNFDDIDGPGNNSFLQYDASSGVFTVVAWDHNLAFGARNDVGGGGGGARPRGGGGAGGGGGRSGNNELVARFKADATFSAMYDAALADLRAALLTGGELDHSVDAWVAVLDTGASDLVDAATVAEEADAVRAYADDAATPTATSAAG